MIEQLNVRDRVAGLVQSCARFSKTPNCGDQPRALRAFRSDLSTTAVRLYTSSAARRIAGPPDTAPLTATRPRERCWPASTGRVLGAAFLLPSVGLNPDSVLAGFRAIRYAARVAGATTIGSHQGRQTRVTPLRQTGRPRRFARLQNACRRGRCSGQLTSPAALSAPTRRSPVSRGQLRLSRAECYPRWNRRICMRLDAGFPSRTMTIFGHDQCTQLANDQVGDAADVVGGTRGDRRDRSVP